MSSQLTSAHVITAFGKVGSADEPMSTFPSTDRFVNRTSTVGWGMPTLQKHDAAELRPVRMTSRCRVFLGSSENCNRFVTRGSTVGCFAKGTTVSKDLKNTQGLPSGDNCREKCGQVTTADVDRRLKDANTAEGL